MMEKSGWLLVPAVMLAIVSVVIATAGLTGCATKNEQAMNQDNRITLMVLDPGHFHASLVQKEMYPGVDSTVYVYAPGGMELEDYLARVNSYNQREEDPTAWNLEVYTGSDYLEKMLEEQPGNLVVLAGNNQRKTEYIDACIDAGLHVYSDKPMAITPADFTLLRSAFEKAEEQGLLLYDIMTERFEITTILQKKLSEQEEIFGGLVAGSVEEPAITKESVHHFFKYVSGKPLQRPAWFFDVTQEGEAIADVGTHLVDLVMWEAVPGGVANYTQDIEILESRRWPTPLSSEQFRKVTGEAAFPGFLDDYIADDTLRAIANSAIDYTVKGIHARVSVEWAFQAPEGAGDTHYSIMRGNTCDLVIRQGEAENYRPELYIRSGDGVGTDVLQTRLELYLKEILGEQYPGIAFEVVDEGMWRVNIPNRYREGHEAHFAQVTQQFLGYMEDGKLPEWEVEQMLAKYYTTTRAVELAADR
ncbi:MAG: putative oxidoreductase C-terminal domain-containing protein [Bacteroidales bacterium]|nr:putative oxidoreductase C-terminal domain-containing protein [Bacteroidales bacterium]